MKFIPGLIPGFYTRTFLHSPNWAPAFCGQFVEKRYIVKPNYVTYFSTVSNITDHFKNLCRVHPNIEQAFEFRWAYHYIQPWIHVNEVVFNETTNSFTKLQFYFKPAICVLYLVSPFCIFSKWFSKNRLQHHLYENMKTHDERFIFLLYVIHVPCMDPAVQRHTAFT